MQNRTPRAKGARDKRSPFNLGGRFKIPVLIFEVVRNSTSFEQVMTAPATPPTTIRRSSFVKQGHKRLSDNVALSASSVLRRWLQIIISKLVCQVHTFLTVYRHLLDILQSRTPRAKGVRDERYPFNLGGRFNIYLYLFDVAFLHGSPLAVFD